MIVLSFAMPHNFIFCNATINKARELKDILDDYCEASGHLVNLKKPAIYFSKGACKNRCNNVAKALGVRFMDKNEKYLGNPLFLKKRKDLSFEPLVSKNKNKINSWRIPLLSQAGRSTLDQWPQPSLYLIWPPLNSLLRRSTKLIGHMREF